MDSHEENYINFTANTEEINVELANESVGSPSFSPVLNNDEIGVNNIDQLPPKSTWSLPNFNLNEEVENSVNLGTNKEEDSGQTRFVNDSKLHLIAEGSNERIKPPSISSKVINDEIGDNQNRNLDVNSKPVKGYGLKKWRRIRRDLSKSTSFDAVSLMNLKRQHSHDEPLDFDKLVENRAFSVGADPESNDDQSSKSSSMASVNKPTYETGFRRDRSRIKNVGLQQRIKRGGSNVEILDSCISNEESESTKKKNVPVPLGIDHFVDSITMLKAAQEALEAEIQNFGDISKSATEGNFDFIEHFEATEFNYSPKLDGHLYELSNKMMHLNYKLEAASAIIKAKEAKVTELENMMKETSDTEFEFEDIIKEKIEAEIVYVIIDKYTQSWKILVEDQISTLFDEQTLIPLSNAEDKFTELKGRAEELDCCCKELLGSEKVLKLKNKIHKISLCSFIQLIMLCFVLGRFLVQLMPPSNEFVPT